MIPKDSNPKTHNKDQKASQDNALIVPDAKWSAKRYAKHLWDDHNAWINMSAVKAGVGAIIAGGYVAFAITAALPFASAAFMVVGAGVLATAGISAITIGVRGSIRSIKEINHKILHEKLNWIRDKNEIAAEEDIKLEKKPSWLHRQLKKANRFLHKTRVRLWKKIENSEMWQAVVRSPVTKRIMNSRLLKKAQKTRAWKIMTSITKDNELALHSFAVTGSISTIATTVSLLATQVFTLPILTMGLATVGCLGMLGAGAYMTYVFGKDLTNSVKKAFTPKKKKASAPKPTTAPEQQPQQNNQKLDQKQQANFNNQADKQASKQPEATNDNTAIPASKQIAKSPNKNKSK